MRRTCRRELPPVADPCVQPLARSAAPPGQTRSSATPPHPSRIRPTRDPPGSDRETPARPSTRARVACPHPWSRRSARTDRNPRPPLLRASSSLRSPHEVSAPRFDADITTTLLLTLPPGPVGRTVWGLCSTDQGTHSCRAGGVLALAPPMVDARCAGRCSWHDGRRTTSRRVGPPPEGRRSSGGQASLTQV